METSPIWNYTKSGYVVSEFSIDIQSLKAARY